MGPLPLGDIDDVFITLTGTDVSRCSSAKESSLLGFTSTAVSSPPSLSELIYSRKMTMELRKSIRRLVS